MTDARLPERWLTDRRFATLSHEAFRSYHLALMWSVANRTDGALLPAELNLIPGFCKGSPSDLVGAGLWTPQSTGWLITDFEQTQTSSAQLRALDENRAKEREKKRRQRAKKADAVTSADPAVPGDIPGDVPREITRTRTRTRTGSYASTDFADASGYSSEPPDPNKAASAADALIARVQGKRPA